MNRFIAALLLLLAGAVCRAQAVALHVLAIEYPPYTSAMAPNYGLAFAKLSQMLAGSDLQVQPRFYSPARAHREVREGHWCASFYPASPSATQIALVALDQQPIDLGLYRRLQPEAFRWSSLQALAGSRIAYYRAQQRDGLGQALEDAGVELFEITTYRQGLQLLQHGRVDYVFGDRSTGQMLMAELGMEPTRYQFSETLFASVTLQVWINLACPEGQALFEHLDRRS